MGLGKANTEATKEIFESLQRERVNAIALIPKKEKTTTKEKMKTLVNIDDVAKYLNIKKRTIYKYVQENYIPHIKINKKVIRFEIAKIDNWLDTLKNDYKGN